MSGWEVLAGVTAVLVGTVGALTPWLKQLRQQCVPWLWGRRISKVTAHGCALLWPEMWLAVKGRNVRAVQAALDLHHPRPCSWLEGLTEADQLFVSPPVKGWILVAGAGLPSPDEDVDSCFRFVLNMSRKLGRVQLFCASTHSHLHAWVKAERGRIVRAYAWSARTLWQQGTPTAYESVLGLKCFGYADGEPGEHLAEAEANLPKVRILAGLWGLDPAQIQNHFLRPERGIAGRPAHRY